MVVHPLYISLWATNWANLPCKSCYVSWKCLHPNPLLLIVDRAVATRYYSLCRFGDKPTSWGFVAPCVSCRNTTPSSMKPFSCKLQASSIKRLIFSNYASLIWNLLILLGRLWSQELKNKQIPINSTAVSAVGSQPSIYCQIGLETLFGSEFRGDKFEDHPST